MFQRQTLLAALAFLVFGQQASAGEPGGIAFSYAPEQGLGVCTGGAPQAAFDCARAKCTESGAAPEDCAPLAWCFPAGWSIGVGVMHKEGIHWSEFSCGWQTKEAAIAAGKLRCEQMDPALIQDCSAGVVYDPQGTELTVE